MKSTFIYYKHNPPIIYFFVISGVPSDQSLKESRSRSSSVDGFGDKASKHSSDRTKKTDGRLNHLDALCIFICVLESMILITVFVIAGAPSDKALDRSGNQNKLRDSSGDRQASNKTSRHNDRTKTANGRFNNLDALCILLFL